MSNHLSQDEFEKCVLGRPGQAELDHLTGCPECRAELEQFRKALSLFRSAIHDLADDRSPLQASDVTTFVPAATGAPRWRWALLAAGCVALIIFTIFISDKRPPVPAEQPSAESPEAIMERLNRHLSRTVPAPMEPVMSLIPSEEFISTPGRIQ